MSILGIGNDIIEIERISFVIQRHGRHFLNRLFSEEEQKHCQRYLQPYASFAGRFSAKEAIAKALGVGISRFLSWKDMQILPSENPAEIGKPCVFFSAAANQYFSHPHILLSISHCREYAIATAIWSQK